MKWYRKTSNKLLRLYLLVGLFVILTVYLVAVSWWISSTIEGINTGAYQVTFTIYTNTLGENYVELALLIVFLPAAAVIFLMMVWKLVVKSDI